MYTYITTRRNNNIMIATPRTRTSGTRQKCSFIGECSAYKRPDDRGTYVDVMYIDGTI